MVIPVRTAGFAGVLRVVLNPRLIMVVVLLGGAAARSWRERKWRARRRRNRARREEGSDENVRQTDESEA